MTNNVTRVNDAPAGTDNTITTNEDTAHTFTSFLSSRSRHTNSLRDWSSDVCSSDLPTGPSGTLTLSGSAVTAGQLVTVAAINAGLLVFTPARSEERRVGKECRFRW